MYIFAFLQFLAILLLFGQLIKSVTPKLSLYALSLGNLLLSLFFLVGIVNSDLYLTFHLVSNTYHLGAFVNMLIALVFSINYIRSNRIIYLIWLFLFGILAIISDRLFITMFCIPLFGALLIFVRRPHNLRKILFLSLVLGAMVALGFVIFDRITHNNIITVAKAFYDFSFKAINESWKTLYSNLLLYFVPFRFFALMISLSLVSFMVSVFIMLRSFISIWKGLKMDNEEGLKHLLNVFFILFMMIVFLMPVLTGGFRGFDTIRYNIFVFYLGPLYLGVLLIYLFNDKRWINKAIKFSCFILLAVLTGFLSLHIVKNNSVSALKNYLSYYPEVASCIDILDEKYELKHGVSTYWNGKVGTQFSKRNVRLYTVYNESLVPYPHVGNENWYYKAGYGKYDPPVFNFILLENPVNESALKTIEEKVGKFKCMEDCGRFKFILVNDFTYKRNNPFPVIAIPDSTGLSNP
jgi:hypothetical protein